MRKLVGLVALVVLGCDSLGTQTQAPTAPSALTREACRDLTGPEIDELWSAIQAARTAGIKEPAALADLVDTCIELPAELGTPSIQGCPACVTGLVRDVYAQEQ